MRQALRTFILALVVGLAWGTLRAPVFAQSETVVDIDGVPVTPPKLQTSSVQSLSGVPSPTCRAGFRQIGNTLCISSDVQAADHFANVLFYCQDKRARVASYGDLYYLYWYAQSLRVVYNANGRWIGPGLISDDNALCGNSDTITDAQVFNFEGTCNKFNIRGYWCAHDLQ
jgi:hypothetical protein